MLFKSKSIEMKLSHNIELYIELFTEIVRMHDEVDYRKHLNSYPGRKGNRRRYPAVSVGAEYCGSSSIGHHHDYSSPEDFHPTILKALLARLGKLNDVSKKNPQCTNKVGHCAENYAASGVLNKCEEKSSVVFPDSLSDVLFTKAFQPRTWKSIDWCDNCRTMFD